MVSDNLGGEHAGSGGPGIGWVHWLHSDCGFVVTQVIVVTLVMQEIVRTREEIQP